MQRVWRQGVSFGYQRKPGLASTKQAKAMAKLAPPTVKAAFTRRGALSRGHELERASRLPQPAILYRPPVQFNATTV